jgi:beta-lactamase regulating signal transducer with metallopeptidase domain
MLGEWVWSQSWQIAAVTLALGLVWRFSRKASAHWRYLLGLVVLLKCLMPAFVNLPLSPPAIPLVRQTDRPPTPAAMARADNQRHLLQPAQPGPAPETNPAETLVAFFVSAWMAGALAILGYAVVKASRIQCNLRRTRAEPDLELECEFLELGRRLGLRGRPKLCLLESAGQPFVWGIWRGCIYLPASFPRLGRARERKVVLAHELAHVLRWDALVNLLQVIAQALFWFHPAVWWLNSRLRQEREKCCDEMAIAALGVEASAYGAALVDHLVAQFNPAVPPSSLAISGRARELEDRLKTILMPGRRFLWRPSGSVLLTILVLAALVLPIRLEARYHPRPNSEQRAAPIALVPDLAFAENWAGAGEYFAEFPTGEQQFGGVPWIIRGVAPVRVSQPVKFTAGRTLQKLHLLHGVDAVAEEGTIVGYVRLSYRDGQVVQLPVRYGAHVRACRFGEFSPVQDPASAMAWTGGNAEVRAAGQALRLYRTTFINPRPAMPVVRVDYAAAGARPAPIWAATTIE